MNDNNKKISPDDEYQFPKEEYAVPPMSEHAASDGAPQDTVKPVSPLLAIMHYLRSLPIAKNKRALLVIAAVIIIIIVFRIVHVDNNTPVVMAPVQSITPAVVTPAVSSPSAGTVQAESAIAVLQTQMSDMQNSLAQAQSANAQLQKSVVALEAQVSALSAQFDQARANTHPAKKGTQISYHLRAVVPDRAWIATSHTGQSVSVTMGDNISQYGSVTAIDAVHGIVETSSGRKIEYGPNDY
jgi:Tfp pilus assembly protein FimV